MTRARHAGRTQRLALAIACAIVLVAAAARIVGLDWDRRRLLHPDERFLVMTTAALAWPDGLAAYLDPATSPLNPRSPGRLFAYGSLPLTLTRAIVSEAGPAPLATIVEAGRRLSVVADLLTLVVLGWLARRILGTRASLIAMTFYACAVLPIQHAHFFVVDPHVTWWSTLAVAALTLWHRRPSWTLAAVAGAAAALAVACKVSGVLLLAPAALAWASHLATPAGRCAPAQEWRRLTGHALLGVCAGLVTLRLAAPDLFAPGWLPWPSPLWLADLQAVAPLTTGHVDFPPGFQWAARAKGWYPWSNLVRFGLGWPLGLVATAATLWAAWRVLARWRSPLLVPTTWTIVVGVVVATSFVGTMRYLLPIYPTLCLLAAWALSRVLRLTRHEPAHLRDVPTSARQVSAVWPAYAARALVVVVVVATAAWAWAFTGIYRQLHPRLAASRWIYDNVPAGRVLTTETWDDPLPIAASVRTTPSRYEILTLRVTDEDTGAKVDHLLEVLDRADYVVLSSDRAAGTLPRLSRRFPVMTRYYAALEDGSLGFDRVATFTAVPRLGPWHLPDLHAEEAFTVYDHPRVRIYRKRDDWSPARARERLLAHFDPGTLIRATALQYSSAPHLLELSPAHRDALRRDGTWRTSAGPGGRFPAEPPSGSTAVLRWFALVAGIGMLAWPACAVLLAGTWGRGLLAAPAVGLLWVAWVVWLWGSLAPWPLSQGVLAGAVASTGALSLLLARRRLRALWRYLRVARWPLALQVLSLVLLAALGVAGRAANPDLWHPTLGGEKPMDIALLSAIVRADRFPAFDPWFAGGLLNYYYAGFIPVAVLSRLTGIEPRFAYTLAIGTWWALTAGGLAIVGATIARHAGLARHTAATAFGAALLGVVGGNLRQLELVAASVRAQVPSYLWFWHASRAIPAPSAEAAPITEFPFFTFLFADLHAHLLAMPWLLSVLLVSCSLVLPRHRSRAWLAGVLALAALLVGMLAATNAWDAPTALALMAGATLLRVTRRTPPRERRWIPRRVVALVGGCVLLAALASAPFWLHFASPAGGVMLWTGARTPWWAGLLVHGPFLLVVVPGLVVLARHRQPPLRAWLATVLALGLLLLAVVEVLALRGDVGRMNTVFKVYLQVWLLWSACLPAAWLLVRATFPAGGWARRLFVGTTVTAALAMIVYPVTATGPRLAHRMAADAPRGLDGTAFMTRGSLTLSDGTTLRLDEDRDLVRWLLDHAYGTPTIIEAQTDQYQWGGRISAHTGLPTVLGWTWHARQQRLALPASLVGRRVLDVQTFYDSSSPDEAWTIALRYDIRYVIVGGLERSRYAAQGLAKFDGDQRWRPVFTRGESVIYERRD